MLQQVHINDNGTPTRNSSIPLQRNGSKALSSASGKQNRQLPDIKVKNSR